MQIRALREKLAIDSKIGSGHCRKQSEKDLRKTRKPVAV